MRHGMRLKGLMLLVAACAMVTVQAQETATAGSEAGNLVVDFATKYPWLTTVFVVMGVARSLFKPTCEAIYSYVASTPSPEDDAFLVRLKDKPWVKVTLFIVDLLFSVKLVKK